ncbi:20670_t:CDS:2 [Gigaspora rosea]|nr:20670_t:CDS:2 [Gigaspora rosea]
MSVVISGTPIALICFVRESKALLKVTIGRDNDVFDFKKIIKNKKPNDLAKIDSDSINLWKLNEPVPKHFRGYQERTLLVIEQMIDIWSKISADSDYSIKRVLSGPIGMGKSYIAYFLVSKAYAEEWPILYIADASNLIVDTSKAEEAICSYFLAQNKDILTATELERIVQKVNGSSEVEVTIAGAILDFIKSANCKALLIVDEHGALFEKDSLPLFLRPLMNLNFWGEQCKFVCVILTGTSYARYEMGYMKYDQSEFWVIFVGPLQSDIFDILLQLHPVLKIQSIKEETKKINKILAIAQIYYNDLPQIHKTHHYDALTSMFLPRITHYLPLCSPAQKALLKMYMSFNLPENIRNQLREEILGRGFDSNPSKNIRQAFEPMSVQAGISLAQIHGRNQIEMYLNKIYGPGHSAKIGAQNRFVVTRNGMYMSGFRIVYIQDSPGIPITLKKFVNSPI